MRLVSKFSKVFMFLTLYFSCVNAFAEFSVNDFKGIWYPVIQSEDNFQEVGHPNVGHIYYDSLEIFIAPISIYGDKIKLDIILRNSDCENRNCFPIPSMKFLDLDLNADHGIDLSYETLSKEDISYLYSFDSNNEMLFIYELKDEKQSLVISEYSIDTSEIDRLHSKNSIRIRRRFVKSTKFYR